MHMLHVISLMMENYYTTHYILTAGIQTQGLLITIVIGSLVAEECRIDVTNPDNDLALQARHTCTCEACV